MADLPKPLPRRAFTARNIAAVFIKHDGRCAACSEKVRLGEYAVDHIQALDHLGAHTLDNWQLLCVGCHKLKTAKDVKASAKGRRLRGDVGTGPKKAIPSRPFSRMAEGRDPKRWQSAGFSKTLHRKMNGKVEAR